MQSINFEHLRTKWFDLAELGADAENYIFSDPQSAVIKLRCFAELIVGHIYRDLCLPSNENANFFEHLDDENFKSVIDRPILDKLHAIRINGNKAAHKGSISSEDALWLVKEAYLIGCWLYITQGMGAANDYQEFITPVNKQNEKNNSNTKNLELEQALQELELIRLREKEAQKELDKLKLEIDKNKFEALIYSCLVAKNNINFEEEETRRRINMKDIYTDKLTDGQEELVDRLEYFISDKTQQVFLLKGYAGTGKTFITKGLTEYFNSVGRNYILAAPTGKAAKVIAQKTKSQACTLHKTIYSFEDVVEYKDTDTDGKETYKFYYELKVNDNSVDTVYIIDEASMIADIYQEAEFMRFGSGFLLQDFLEYANLDCNDHNKKIIFIGDDAQLPPVGMNYSPALNAKYLLEKYNLNSTWFELTEVVRQEKDSGIIQNSTNIRESIATKTFNQLNIMSYPDIEHIEHSNLMPKYLNSCSNKINGESIIIAFSNSDVADYNRRVRQHFFPDQEKLCRGDKVMATSNSVKDKIEISNGDFGLVRKILSATETMDVPITKNDKIQLSFIDIEIGFKDLNGESHFFECKIIENLLYSKQPTLSSDENKALYIDFKINRSKGLSPKSTEFKNALKNDPYFNALKIKFGYAITCHKAQGSEWNHVFVNCKTHQSILSAGYFRWLYTAITRASKKLYLLDAPTPIKIGGGMTPIANNGFQIKTGKTPINNSNVQQIEIESEHENLFGINPQNYFLIAILNTVKQHIHGQNIEIIDIHHNNYQEAYIFSSGNESARADIIYNGKNRISGISTISSDSLGNKIVALLKPLEGELIIANKPNENQEEKQFNFEEPFLKEFYERVIGFCLPKNIIIEDIQHNQYHERYTFIKNNEIATFKFDYNSRKQFAKFSPLQSMCTSATLVNEIYEIIKEMSL